jgi:hypothetical protein
VRAPVVAWVIGVALVFHAARLVAQDPVLNRPLDSARVDTAHVRRDTLSTTDRLLKVQKDLLIRRAALPRSGTDEVQPAGSRTVFTRDSIDWATAQSVAELLARIPGVYLERAGWIGSAVLPNYMAHGAASVTYELDGVPQVAIGPDSLAWDPSTIPLGILDSVDVTTTPGSMRVRLFTRAYDRQAPRTKVGVAQGDRGIARYFASFERRYTNGIGLSAAADYFGVNSLPTGGANTIGSGWVQFGYVPTPRFGIQGQVITQSIDRGLLLNSGNSDTLLAAVKGSRTDASMRAAWRQRDDGLGAGIDLLASHTEWSSDSAPGNEGIGQFGAVASMRAPTWSAVGSGWYTTRWTPLSGRMELGWSPTRLITGSIEGDAQHHSAARNSHWAAARVGVLLPLGFSVGVNYSGGSKVQSPSIETQHPFNFVDAQATAGFKSKLLAIDAGYAHDAGWRPESFSEFAAINAYAPLAQTNWITVHARLTPINWFTLETAYQNPLHGILPDGVPPQHGLTTATIRSRFLRNFPSGIFQLKLQAVMETWSPGIGGRDATGAAIPLPGATFFRSVIQLQLGPFIAYYDRVNLQAVRLGTVPGYPIQSGGTTFGIRWEFSN